MHSHLHTEKNKGIFAPSLHFFAEIIAKFYPSTACEEVMNLLEECHDRGFLWKSMGMCNEAKRNVNKCLGELRRERTKSNRDEAKARAEKRKQIFAEIDANS